MAETNSKNETGVIKSKSPKSMAVNGTDGRSSTDNTDKNLTTDLNQNDLASEMDTLNMQENDWDEQSAMEMYENELSEAFELPPTQFMLTDDNKMKYTNNLLNRVEETIGDTKADITVKVGKDEFKVHKYVLSAASEYFESWKDKSSVEVKEANTRGFSGLLGYIYTGHVTIDSNVLQDLMSAARFFKVTWVEDACYDCLLHHLSFDDYENALKLAENLSLEHMQADIYRYMAHNLSYLVEQPNFFKKLSLKLLTEFLGNNIYVDAHERFLLELVMHWVNADKAERLTAIWELLRLIRFGLMEFEELDDLPQEVFQYPDIKNEIQRAKDYALDIPSQSLKSNENLLQRGSHPSIIILSFTAAGKFLAYKDPSRPGIYKEELGMTGLQLDYECASQSTLGNFLYAAGGYNEKISSVPRMFRFDPRYRDWMELASMNQSRVSFAMCSSDNKLFAIGGILHYFTEEDEEKEEVIASVEMYSPDDNSWAMMQPLPCPTFDQSATFMNNCVYVSGGISSKVSDPVPLQTAYCLDVATNKWKCLSPMKTHRQGHCMSSYKGKIYVIGGYTSSGSPIFKDCNINEVYNPETDQWTEIKHSPESMGHILRSSGILNNKMYFLSRSSNKKYLYSYDLEKDDFDEGEEMDRYYQKLAIINTAYPYQC